MLVVMDEVSCATGCSCHAHLHSAAQSLEVKQLQGKCQFVDGLNCRN